MLGEENWVPSAAEARDAGLVREVVEPHELVARASCFVEERIAAGGGRCFDEAEHERLRRVNAEESATLANAFVSPKFLGAMEAFNAKRPRPPARSSQAECGRRLTALSLPALV